MCSNHLIKPPIYLRLFCRLAFFQIIHIVSRPPDRQLYLFALVSGRKKTSGASFGTLNSVADCESELNLESVEGLSRECFSSVLIRVPSAGWLSTLYRFLCLSNR